MIPLQRSAVPSELDDAKKLELTERFKVDGSSVWNIPFIKKPLLASSNGKCAYCETRIDEESKYMEVDHFRCKADFPELVAEWSNLIPSCKRCNVQKSSWNVEKDGWLVDPFLSRPNSHLYMKNYRIIGRDQVGRDTIDAMYLNDSDRLVAVRFQIGQAIHAALDIIRSQLQDFLNDNTRSRKLTSALRGVEKLLTEAGPQTKYSATAATVLLDDDDYIWIRERLSELGFWDQFAASEKEAQNCSLQL